MNSKTKALLMAIVAFLATTISNLEKPNWGYVFLATVSFTLIYLAKNYILPSTSEEGRLNWRDALSGLIIAIAMGISSFAASVLTTGKIDWNALLIAIIGSVVGYFTKTLPSGKK